MLGFKLICRKSTQGKSQAHCDEATQCTKDQQLTTERKASTETYIPRRSRRVRPNVIQADHDIWVENMAYDKRKMKRRSYFQSQNTRKRRWDEPPSGASHTVLLRDRQKYDMVRRVSRTASVRIEKSHSGTQGSDDLEGERHLSSYFILEAKSTIPTPISINPQCAPEPTIAPAEFPARTRV